MTDLKKLAITASTAAALLQPLAPAAAAHRERPCRVAKISSAELSTAVTAGVHRAVAARFQGIDPATSGKIPVELLQEAGVPKILGYVRDYRT